MNNKRGRLIGGLLLALNAGLASAAYQLNFQPPVTRITSDIYDLHTLIFVICCVIFVVVFGAMFYSIFKHRKSLGHAPANFHESTAVEIAWAVVPFVIVFLMVLPAARAVVAMKDTSNADITIKATGMQWKWGYDYLNGDGEGISFFSNPYVPRRLAVDPATVKSDNFRLEVDNPVVVPVNRKIRMVLTANDVIHSWHIPDLGVKQDAIPGLARDTWFNAQQIGTYRGLCSVEACGAGRACLLIVVNVVSDDDYKKWVDGKKEDMAANADNPGEIRTVGVLTQRGGKSYAAN